MINIDKVLKEFDEKFDPESRTEESFRDTVDFCNAKTFLSEALTTQHRETLEEVERKIESLKPILWDDDMNKHAKNVEKHNTLDEILSIITNLKTHNGEEI